jgi:hypothetical protein
LPLNPPPDQPETGERTSDSPRPVPGQSNVVTFPGTRPASNVRAVGFPRPPATGIAAELMLNTGIENDHLRFAVFHSAEMLMRLEKEYGARWIAIGGHCHEAPAQDPPKRDRQRLMSTAVG